MATSREDQDTGSDMPAETGRSRRRWLWAGALVVVLGLAGLAVLFAASLLDRPPDDLWAAATYMPDPECEAGSPDCPVLIEPFPVGHGGDASDTAVTMLAVSYPRLDDPIAQWGQCMDTVLTCLAPAQYESDAERAGRLRSCVAEAACPQACRDRFASRAGEDLASAHAAFLEIFVEEDAWCAPQQ